MKIWRVYSWEPYERDSDVSYHATEAGAEKQRLRIWKNHLRCRRSYLDETKNVRAEMKRIKSETECNFLKELIEVRP